MAETKAPTNPDSTLSWGEMVKKAVTQAQEIAKALEPIAKVNRDADGKEQKPLQDKAGLTYQTVRAVKAEYRKRQKKNGGNYDLGDATAKKSAALRIKLEACYKLALEVASDAQECETTERRMTADYAKANKPKLAAQAKKAKEAAARAAEKAKVLEAQLAS